MTQKLTIIELEDRGQDFTRLFLNSRSVITGAAPFQGWLWRGYRVTNKSIRRGTQLTLKMKGREETTLKYRVVRVAKVKRGVCRYCGCTDAGGCVLGADLLDDTPITCSWLDKEHTVCSKPSCAKAHRKAAA